MERPENRKGCGLDAGSRPDHDGGAELCPCTGRNWRSDNGALGCDRNHLTGWFRVAGGRVAFALDMKVVNEWVSNGWSYGEETERNECVVRTPSWANPKVHEDLGYVGALGRDVLGWEHRGCRKG